MQDGGIDIRIKRECLKHPNVFVFFSLLSREKMAFFTRPRFNIPPLPADDVWALVSVSQHEVKVKVLELMKYKAVSTEDTGRLTQMMLQINKVSHVQTRERGRSGDERADIGCRFPLWGSRSHQETLLSAPLSYSWRLRLKEKPNAGGREQKFG